jgi:FkbM family methyltransferase
MAGSRDVSAPGTAGAPTCPRHSARDALVGTMRRIWTHPENRGRRARRLVRWVTWQAWQRTARRPWTVSLHCDIQMICHPHDHITSLALYCGLYDAEEMRFLLAWLRAGDTFVDVGSNVAPYSLLSTAVRGTRAVAFEPGTLAQVRARANIDLNGVRGRVTLVPLAVSDADGEASLTADRWATNALVDDRYDGPVEHVTTTRLDSYDEEHGLGRVSLIKIDVEGHELAVLRGAGGIIGRDHPALIVEVNDPLALRRHSDELGYVAISFDPATGMIAERRWPDRRGGNVILVPHPEQARERVASPTVPAPQTN